MQGTLTRILHPQRNVRDWTSGGRFVVAEVLGRVRESTCHVLAEEKEVVLSFSPEERRA
jgi:hypothetical protein